METGSGISSGRSRKRYQNFTNPISAEAWIFVWYNVRSSAELSFKKRYLAKCNFNRGSHSHKSQFSFSRGNAVVLNYLEHGSNRTSEENSRVEMSVRQTESVSSMVPCKNSVPLLYIFSSHEKQTKGTSIRPGMYIICATLSFRVFII